MNELITPRDVTNEMLRLSRLLDESHDNLVKASHDFAQSERDYRLAKATAHLASSGTVDERRAYVDKACSGEMYNSHLAEGLKTAALEKVRSVRAQLSALQSVANAVRSEVEMAGRL